MRNKKLLTSAQRRKLKVLEKAKKLYLENHTCVEIAKILKKSDRIIYKWVKDYGWQRDKAAIMQQAIDEISYITPEEVKKYLPTYGTWARMLAGLMQFALRPITEQSVSITKVGECLDILKFCRDEFQRAGNIKPFVSHLNVAGDFTIESEVNNVDSTVDLTVDEKKFFNLLLEAVEGMKKDIYNEPEDI